MLNNFLTSGMALWGALICLGGVLAGAPAGFDWIGNGIFAGGQDITAKVTTKGYSSIVLLADENLPKNDDAKYALKFPEQNTGGFYQIKNKVPMDVSPGKFLLMASAFLTDDFAGNTMALYSVWYNQDGQKIGQTWDGCGVDVSKRGKWQDVLCTITVTQKPNRFELFLGYPRNSQVGTMYITAVSVQKERKCEKGYKLFKNRCLDIDECAKNNGNCHKGTTCSNKAGTYECSACPKGYFRPGDSITKCQDIDECADAASCATPTKCTNSPGDYSCTPCPTGFEGNPKTEKCSDVNECLSANGGCHIGRKCINTLGSFECSACKQGYTTSGKLDCIDEDECKVNNGGCDHLAACVNTPGNRQCGPCPVGYLGNGENGCDDLNECKKNNGGCDPYSRCVNIPGGRECGPCQAGMQGDGVNGCKGADAQKKESKEDIAKMTAKKATQRTSTMLGHQKALWQQQEKERQDLKVKRKEIDMLGARIANLKWKAKFAQEHRMAKEAKDLMGNAMDTITAARDKVAQLYSRHLQGLPPLQNDPATAGVVSKKAGGDGGGDGGAGTVVNAAEAGAAPESGVAPAASDTTTATPAATTTATPAATPAATL